MLPQHRLSCFFSILIFFLRLDICMSAALESPFGFPQRAYRRASLGTGSFLFSISFFKIVYSSILILVDKALVPMELGEILSLPQCIFLPVSLRALKIRASSSSLSHGFFKKSVQPALKERARFFWSPCTINFIDFRLVQLLRKDSRKFSYWHLHLHLYN